MIALLLLALLPAGDEPVEPQSAASVFVRYDLRPVIPRLDQGSGWQQSLVPDLAKPYENVPGVALHRLYEPAAPDVILDLLTQILGDELVFEGRSIALERDNRLLVLAPPATQAKVATVLEVLESVLSASVHLRLDVLTTSGGSAPEREGGCVVSTDEAERLVAGLVARGAAHREHTLQLSAGRTAAVQQVRSVPFLFDYDVEIAQGCFVFDPIMVQAESGLRLLARGVPVPGGVALALFVGHAGAVGEIEERPLNVRGVVGDEQKGLSAVEGPQTVQTTQLLTRAVAFNTLLPDDRALVVSCTANVVGKSESQTLVLRRTGGGLVSFSSSAIAGTERKLVMVNTEFLSPPEFALSGGPWMNPELAGHPWLVAFLNAEPSPFLFDWMKYRYSVWRRFGPWALIVTDPTWGDQQSGAELARLVSGARTEADLLEVEIELVAGDGDAAPRPVRWSLPVLTGTAFGTVLGMTGTAVADYDVEVAQFSGVPDPRIMTTFDGLALAAEISGASAGPDGWILDARGTAHLFRRPMPSFSPGGVASGRIEEPTYDSLQVDERLSVPRTPGAPARVRIGPRAGEPGTPGLGLVISIADS